MYHRFLTHRDGEDTVAMVKFLRGWASLLLFKVFYSNVYRLWVSRIDSGNSLGVMKGTFLGGYLVSSERNFWVEKREGIKGIKSALFLQKLSIHPGCSLVSQQ